WCHIRSLSVSIQEMTYLGCPGMMTSLLAAIALNASSPTQLAVNHDTVDKRPAIVCDTQEQIKKLAALSLANSPANAKDEVNEEYRDPAKPDVIVCGAARVG